MCEKPIWLGDNQVVHCVECHVATMSIFIGWMCTRQKRNFGKNDAISLKETALLGRMLALTTYGFKNLNCIILGYVIRTKNTSIVQRRFHQRKHIDAKMEAEYYTINWKYTDLDLVTNYLPLGRR